MPSGPPPSAVSAGLKARRDFLAQAAEKGYDPKKGDPNIISQGYTPVVDTTAGTFNGLVTSYDKANAEGYTVNYNSDLSQINKATKDGWSYIYDTDKATGNRYVVQVYNPDEGGAVYDASGKKVGDLMRGSSAGNSFLDDISTVALPIALAFVLPGAGAALGAELFAAQIAAGAMTAATATAIGTAIVSTAAQTSQGVDFETALQNATVNAVVSTGSPSVANEIAKTVGNPGVADAITSGGASIASTLAKGGSAEDALKNASAAIVASGVSGQTDRTVGAAVGGAITGGATGATLGAVGELGRPTGGSTAPTTTPSDSVDTTGASGVSGDVVVTAPRETTIGDTNIQTPSSVPNAPEVVVTAPRAPTGIGDTNIQVADTVSTTPPATRTEAPVEITAPRIPTNIAETDIQNVDVVGEKEKNEELISEGTTKEPSLYKPNLFVYSGKYPSAGGGALSRALGTDLQTAGGASTPTTGLTSYRAAGEIEGEETGGKRRNVWNEESLRLKDALGL